MYEHKTDAKLPWPQFLLRQLRHLAISSVLVGLALGAGAIGYHTIEHQGWIDAIYSAAMILTGMGPVDHLSSDNGKVFATLYALFSGVIFVTAAAVMLAPGLHRILHSLHAIDEDADLRRAARKRH